MQTTSANILAKLIAFDTTSYKSNLHLINYVSDLLLEHKVSCERVFDESGQKANLYATIGPKNVPGVLLSGHTDVVPAEGQTWRTDPYHLHLNDGQFYGRGTADMKGFIASVLASVPAMQAQPLRTPIHLAFSYDEEVGCLGVRRLIEMLVTHPVRPILALIGEPTSMKLVTGHKGKTALSVSVTGQAGHSAYTADAVNAIEYAARLISHINAQHRKRARQGPFEKGFRVPHTTLHVGTISGGSALNVVPQSCRFKFEVRNIPKEHPGGVIKAIQAMARELQTDMLETSPDASIAIVEDTAYPGLNTDPEHPAVLLLQQILTGDNTTEKVSFGTEGGLFSQALGIPAIVCGPGNIAQAHKADEFLAQSQLALCDRFIHRLLMHCRMGL